MVDVTVILGFVGGLLRFVEKHSQSRLSYNIFDDSQLSYRTDFIEVYQ